jgi:sugar transferase (PEP-CTERM/EpsH1 system associated)
VSGRSSELVDNDYAPTAVGGVTRRPLRVMHLMLKLGFGGSEAGVLKLVNGFDRSRIRPSICSCLRADSIKGHLKSDVSLFEMNRARGNDLRFVANLWRLLRRERPDILHTHGWATLCEGLIAARMAGVPIVVHGEHGTMETRARNRIIQRIGWSMVDQVLSVSFRLTEKLSATVKFPQNRIKTIRNGVDLERFTPLRRGRARSAFGFAEDDVVVGTVGRFEAVKDQQNYIDALGTLSNAGIKFKALIVGDGPLRDQLIERANTRNLDRSLIFMGMRVDIETILACLDIFVLSSRSEGLSNTIQEAMASGVAVVATDVGGTSELVQHRRTGLLVPPSDSQALASAIRGLVDDSASRIAMGRAGRARVEAEFDLDRMIRGYETLYEEVARSRSMKL